jgi:Spy/CpxP family protein refolding chaperone
MGHHMMGGPGMGGGMMMGGMMGGMCKGMSMMPWMMMKVAKKIGLTEDQMMKMRDVMMNMKREKIKLRSEAELAKLDLKSMMMQDKPDMAAIEQKVMDMSKLKAQMHMAWIKAMMEMKGSLTDEQRKRIKMKMMGMMGGEGEEEEGEEED